jgi:hypothetical protein
MRNGTPRIAFVVALSSAAAGCGTEDVFEQRLSSNERLVELEAVAKLGVDDEGIGQVTVVGDIDGDGIADAIVRTYYVAIAPSGAHAFGSGVFVAYGGTGIHGELDVTSLPALTGAGELSGGNAAAAGDVDGDGLADFLVGIGRTPGCGNPAVEKFGDAPENGGAFLVYGSRTRLTGTTPIANVGALLRDATPCTMADGVAGLGDLDGDGEADFAISRMGADGTSPAVAYLFYGRGQRLTGTVDLAATADVVITTSMPWLRPLLGVGDVDGDGHRDFVVSGSSALGQDVRLVHGAATRLSGTVAVADIARTQFPSDNLCRLVPASLGAALGDLDGDGRDDFSLVSCHDGVPPLTEESLFTIEQRVFYGRAGGFPAKIAAGDQDATIGVSQGRSEMASADLDGDGKLDVIVTETHVNGRNGRVHVFRGSGQRLSGSVETADSTLTYVGMQQRGTRCEYVGADSCVVDEDLGDQISVGNVTGDQRADLLINAPAVQSSSPTLGRHGSALGHVYIVSPPRSNP